MQKFIIEQKPWYNTFLQIYQTIIVINDIPSDLTNYIKRGINIKMSDFSQNKNGCLYYFIKQDCGYSAPLEINDLNDLIHLLSINNYEILYKETKLIKEFNKNLIFVIKKLI